MARAQWLPGAHIDGVSVDGGSFTGGPAKLVLHSTETKNRPSVYGGGGAYPHLNITWNGKTFDVVQYIPFDRAARALENHAGGVQTNRDEAIQIEITGTCNPGAPDDGRLHLESADDDVLRELGNVIRRVCDVCDIDLVVVDQWAPLSKNGRATKSVRMSMSEWDNFGGICGHEHVPENSHIDPGSLNVERALELSAVTGSPVPEVFKKPAKRVKPAPAKVERHEKAPAFPLPAGHWFGPFDAAEPMNHSGFYSAGDRAKLRVWQARMRERGWKNSKGQPLVVDGLFGKETLRVCKLFQEEKGLTVDGLVGPKTWAAAWTAPVT